MAADLRHIYEAPTAEEAARQLDAFEEKWVGKYPSIAPASRRAWTEVTPFYAFSAAIRKIIYTTNAVESLNRVLRKTLKTKGSFPIEEAANKLIFLAIRNLEKGGRAVREWVAARTSLLRISRESDLSAEPLRRLAIDTFSAKVILAFPDANVRPNPQG